MIEGIIGPLVVVFELLMLLICVLGDRAISSSVAQWLRALADASTHGAVGALSWAIVCVGQLYSEHPLFEVALSGALAVGVDVDHFIASWSLSIQAALSLTKRGAFHNSTLIPVITGLLFLGLKYLCPLKLYPVFANVPLIFFISWSSHHIRDATRRGLWFAPFGSTPPLPTWLYRSLVAGMPLLLRLIMILRHGRSLESNIQQPSDPMSVV